MACSVSPALLLPVGLFPGRGTEQGGKVLHRAGHTTLATHTHSWNAQRTGIVTSSLVIQTEGKDLNFIYSER